MPEKLSAARYAQRIGVTKQAIGAAIKAGRLEKSVEKTKGGYLIDPEIADQEWAAAANPNHFNPNKQAAEPSAPKQQIEAPGSDGGPTLATAKKALAVFKAKTAELEYKEKLGELVSKRAVYRELFAYGQQIRGKLQAIPDQVIDDLLAAGTRQEAHRLLHDIIVDVLTEVTKLTQKNQTDDQ